MVALNALGTTTWPVNVSNVSSGATEATLREFFSFCGAVGDIVLAPSTDGATQEGTVHFLTEAGAETALVLDMALIVDRPISIRAAVADHPLVPDQRDAAPVAEPLYEAPYSPPPPALMPTPPMQQQPSMADYGSSAPAGPAGAGASAPSAADPPDAADYQYPRLAALLDAGYQPGQLTCTLHPRTSHISPLTAHLSPFTLHPSPLTLRRSPFTLHPSPFTLHPPFTLHTSPSPRPHPHPHRSPLTPHPSPSPLTLTQVPAGAAGD